MTASYQSVTAPHRPSVRPSVRPPARPPARHGRYTATALDRGWLEGVALESQKSCLVCVVMFDRRPNIAM